MCIASYNHWRKERAGGGQSPLRGALGLSLTATRPGAREQPCKTRPQPTSMWAAPAFRERLGNFDATKQPCGLLIKS
ncbi:hypothetical protein AWP98_22115 [Escherichia coli]|nr:hypothetical protein AWP98_22115 [Escherichia coli]